VLRSILEQSGCRVATASDGAEALRMLDGGEPPDLILLDWMLPGISGLEVCHRVRQRWDAATLPILMVTAKTDPESAYAAFDAGASDYVPKPFRAVEIRARVAAHLRTRRLAEERRRMEERLREREKLSSLGLLASGVAHELNNPLAVIAGHAQLLLRREEDPAAQAQIREVLDAAARCRKITGELLGFARRRPAQRVPTDAGEVLRATLALRERALREAGVHPVADLAPRLPPVLADAHQLQQVFLNLLLNAEQALRGSAGRTLRVSAWAEGLASAPGTPAREGDEEWVVARFFNDGPPIPPEALPHIFEPFFTTKGEEEGTGLGLPISLRIVQEHGGDLSAESGPEGTVFRVRLPARRRG
jgi:signal transduction histidine kinase